MCYDVVCCSHPHTSSPYCSDDNFFTVTDILCGQFVGKCKFCRWKNNFILFINWKLSFQGNNNSKDFEEIVYKREQPLIWREDNVNNGTNGEKPINCRNSVQGKTLLVDDEGYVCSRNKVMINGCCDSNASSFQYSCDTCNEDEGCCAVFEKCVSCCLNPSKVCRPKYFQIFIFYWKRFHSFSLGGYRDRFLKERWNWHLVGKLPYLPQ